MAKDVVTLLLCCFQRKSYREYKLTAECLMRRVFAVKISKTCIENSLYHETLTEHLVLERHNQAKIIKNCDYILAS